MHPKPQKGLVSIVEKGDISNGNAQELNNSLQIPAPNVKAIIGEVTVLRDKGPRGQTRPKANYTGSRSSYHHSGAPGMLLRRKPRGQLPRRHWHRFFCTHFLPRTSFL